MRFSCRYITVKPINLAMPLRLLACAWRSVFIFCCTGLLVLLLAVVPSPSLVSDRIKRHVQMEELAVATANNASFIHCKDNVFWPQKLDQRVKAPFSKLFWENFAARVRSLCVVSLESGCGRSSPKNRLAVLSDGTRVCCRYPKTDSDIRAEVYSYHLNGLIGLWNIPPVVAVKVNMSNWQWSIVQEEIRKAQWKNGESVIISLFISNLEEVYFPGIITDNSTLLLSRINALPFVLSETNLLIQWTDMIMFDFLIGHNDRTVENLRHIKKHPDGMQEKPIHNLYKTQSSELVLIDHESTFNYFYTRPSRIQNPERYSMQLRFLNTLCIFRGNTITAILHLNQINGRSPLDVLESYIHEVDPYSYRLAHSTKFNRRFQLKNGMKARIYEILRRLWECSCLQ